MSPKQERLVIRHLDEFPYGGKNKVRFFLGDRDVTRSVAGLLKAYWEEYCAWNDAIEVVRFGPDSFETALIETGESFTESDLADAVRMVISLPVVTKLLGEE